jgi:hypothetical protein
MPKHPKPHVRKHLEKRSVDPERVPDNVMDTLNDMSEDELNAMHRVGESMEEADVDIHLRVSMMH